MRAVWAGDWLVNKLYYTLLVHVLDTLKIFILLSNTFKIYQFISLIPHWRSEIPSIASCTSNCTRSLPLVPATWVRFHASLVEFGYFFTAELWLGKLRIVLSGTWNCTKLSSRVEVKNEVEVYGNIEWMKQNNRKLELRLTFIKTYKIRINYRTW